MTYNLIYKNNVLVGMFIGKHMDELLGKGYVVKIVKEKEWIKIEL